MRIAVIAALIAATLSGEALAQGNQTPKAQTAPKAQAAPKTHQAAKPIPTKAAPAKPNLEQLASEGNADAQLELGQTLLKGGKSVRKNPAEAIQWLALAAANGKVEAAQALAQGHEQGWFGKRDLVQAAQWWYQAGELGDTDAQQRFLTLYLDGQTDSIGGPTGVRWLEQLATQDDPRALLALGRVYEFGQGMVPDHAKAQRWYRQAALAGNIEAQFRLGSMLLSEPAVWRLLYKDVGREKDNTERDTFYGTRKAALDSAGNDRWVDIMRPGMLHGEYWLTRAALRGSSEAALTLGQAYLGGCDLPFDVAQAWRWLSIAALAGEPQAMKLLADLAASGQGLYAADPVRAWVNYDLAAGAGLKDAEDARDKLSKTMNARQLNRARQIAADLRAS